MSNLYFEANKVNVLKTYIEPDNIFRIPRFQRPYSWEENQIEDFWDTILEEEATFLGTIIFNIEDYEKSKIIDIIDGQQRYLTITILGAVLRDFLWNKRIDDFSEECRNPVRVFQKKFIGKEDDFDSNKKIFYLLPIYSIEEYFQKYIQPLPFDNVYDIKKDSPKKGSQESRVRAAYMKFWDLVSAHLSSNQIFEFQDIFTEFQKIFNKLSSLFFVRIDIKSDEFAYEIFETVNARGVELGVSDLIKNQIFKNVVGANNQYIDEAKSKWEEIELNLSSVGFNLKEFLSYYWSSKHNYVSDKKLYHEIRKQLKNDKDWKLFLNDLLYSSAILKDILSGDINDLISLLKLDYHRANLIYKSLMVLRNLKAKTWIILYLSIFRNYSRIKENYNLNNFWVKFEKFTFVYFHIANSPANWYFKFITDFSKEIENSIRHNKPDETILAIFDTSISTMMEKYPSRANFIEGIKNIQYKHDSKTKFLIKYIFKEIEQSVSKRFSEGFDESLISIEHILPQDPKNWGLKRTEIKDVVNLLGNLTLVTQHNNSTMSNSALDSKIDYFKKSTTVLTQELIDMILKKEWDFSLISQNNFEAINLRTTYLAEIASNIWPNTN